MKKRCIQMLALAVALSLGVNAAHAQVEIGVDGGFVFQLDSPKTTTFNIPFQSVRFGTHLNEKLSFEVRFGTSIVKVEGFDAITQISISASPLFYFGPSGSYVRENLRSVNTKSRAYFRPLAALFFAEVVPISGTQVSLGAAIGGAIPLTEHFGVRVEGLFAHGFDNDTFAEVNSISIRTGFSVFLN